MIFVSKRRFHDEVERRVCEEMRRYEDWRSRDDLERRLRTEKDQMEARLIQLEKACGIDHPSHHRQNGFEFRI